MIYFHLNNYLTPEASVLYSLECMQTIIILCLIRQVYEETALFARQRFIWNVSEQEG